MLKKIALATALLATASFATWDKFPVLEANKGQAEVGAKYMIAGDVTQLGMFAQARSPSSPTSNWARRFPSSSSPTMTARMVPTASKTFR